MAGRLKRSFRRCAEGRWLALIEFIEDALEVENLLRRYWRRERMKAAIKFDKEDEDYTELSKAILSPFFWVYMKMLVFTNGVLVEFAHWCEGCPCHPVPLPEPPYNPQFCDHSHHIPCTVPMHLSCLSCLEKVQQKWIEQ